MAYYLFKNQFTALDYRVNINGTLVQFAPSPHLVAINFDINVFMFTKLIDWNNLRKIIDTSKTVRATQMTMIMSAD